MFVIDENEIDSGKGCYLPTPYYKIANCFKKLKTLSNGFKESIFIDIGSGTGRVLFVSALKGFRYVIGVELSTSLCDINGQNVEAHLDKATKYRIYNRDSMDIQFHDIINDSDKKIHSLVFYIGGVYIEDLSEFVNNLNKLDDIEIYIINLGPQKNKIKFEDNNFSIIYENIRERSKLVQKIIKRSGAFKYSYNKPIGYRIYKKMHDDATGQRLHGEGRLVPPIPS